LPQRLDDGVEIERHVLVNDVAEPGEALERVDDFRGKSSVPRQVAHGFRVVLEAIATSRRELTGAVDDELRHHQQREEHVVVQR
jgi:hypothetical protein